VRHVGDVRGVELADVAIPVEHQLQQRTHPVALIVRSGRMALGA
jgi:hypothetical protein